MECAVACCGSIFTPNYQRRRSTSTSLLRLQRKATFSVYPRRHAALSVRVTNLSCKDVGTIMLSTVLSGMFVLAPPSFAEVKTIPASEVSAIAKPLTAEKVEKKRVWFVFVVGAASLFVLINVIENNPSWFPAVSRANKAMSIKRRARFDQADRLELTKAEEDVVRSTRAVEKGLQEARKRRLDRSQGGASQHSAEMKNGQTKSDFRLQKDPYR